jgi:outer membrane biosynthesis protein TonB
MIFRLIGTSLVGISLLASVPVAQAQDLTTTHKAWTRSIHAKIENGKRYPPQALKRRIEGYVVVRFTIDRSGTSPKS